MSCCPDGSWGSLITPLDHYVPTGKMVKERDMDIYVVGSAEHATGCGSGKCIIFNYDIFGIDGGRSKVWCDILAENGFLVLMPDFYRDGTWHDPASPGTVEFLKEHTQWSKLKVDVEETVLPLAKKMGATSFGAIGTCWGTYMVLRECAYSEFKAGISMHPSHSPISQMIGEEEKALLEAVQCPQLFMPAGNDHENVKPSGLGSTTLGSKLRIEEFPDMVHGWTTRGDLAKDKVERDVKKAIRLALDFFKEHV